jgi:hypothetical protein
MARMTKTERLLREVKRRGGMTHNEITTYLAGGRNRVVRDGMITRDYWNAQLFGTRVRLGLVGRFLKVRKNGMYVVAARPPRGHFYPLRNP